LNPENIRETMMYTQAFNIYLRLFPMLASIALLIEGSALFLSDTARFGGSFVAYIVLLIAFHRSILLNEKYSLWGNQVANEKGSTKLPFLPFSGRVILFFLPLFLVFIGLSIALYAAGIENTSAAVFLAFGATALVFPFWGALAGTMLPAAAINGDSSFSSACNRGRQTYWRTVGRLFLGPVLFPVVMFAIIIFSARQFPMLFAADYPVWAMFLAATVGTMIGFFTPLLTATALSMAYRIVEPKA
jgi:hypothetical protein